MTAWLRGSARSGFTQRTDLCKIGLTMRQPALGAHEWLIEPKEDKKEDKKEGKKHKGATMTHKELLMIAETMLTTSAAVAMPSLLLPNPGVTMGSVNLKNPQVRAAGLPISLGHPS